MILSRSLYNMKVVVSSTNPIKLEATQLGFVAYFKKDIECLALKVESGVSNQPVGDDETVKGALQRVIHAKDKMPDADYWIGLEGGVEWYENTLYAFAWIVIMDKEGKTGKAKTSMFELPQKVVQLIREGKELAEADDIVFGIQNSKQKMGAVGLLTDGMITRASYYAEAVKLALIPFIKHQYYG